VLSQPWANMPLLSIAAPALSALSSTTKTERASALDFVRRSTLLCLRVTPFYDSGVRDRRSRSQHNTQKRALKRVSQANSRAMQHPSSRIRMASFGLVSRIPTLPRIPRSNAKKTYAISLIRAISVGNKFILSFEPRLVCQEYSF